MLVMWNGANSWMSLALAKPRMCRRVLAGIASRMAARQALIWGDFNGTMPPMAR
ncbi:hypothetical protein D3C73_1340770 [compost metagenome]